jgi:tetratricopeptide (TPR) repeat protein
MSDPATRSAHLALTESDQYVSMLGYLAYTMAFLGYLDQARIFMAQAMSEARQLQHAFTLAWALGMAGAMATFVRAAIPDAKQLHDEQVAISREHFFPYQLGVGVALCGRALVALGQPDEGLRLWREGFETFRATGAVLLTPWLLALAARICAACGRTADGLNFLAEAARIMETAEDRLTEAELYHLRGELLYATGDPGTAETNYVRALAIARQQSARYLELRAATSLGCLWRDQGKRTEARDLLAPIYGWFTEGFDTPVLQDAKALLDQVT